MNFPTRLNVRAIKGNNVTSLHLEGTLIAEPRIGGVLRIKQEVGKFVTLRIVEVYEDLTLGRIVVEAQASLYEHDLSTTIVRQFLTIEKSMVQRGWLAPLSPPNREDRMPNFSDPVLQQQMSGDKH